MRWREVYTNIFSVTRNGRRSNRTIIEKIAQTLNIDAYKIIEKDIDCIVKKKW